MSLEIKEIKFPNRSRDFLLLPWKIYRDDKNWVPPLLIQEKSLLNPLKHPFFKHSEVEFFVVYKDKNPVGRISAILNNNHNKFHNENICFFGFFECINDKDIARTLFEAVEKFAKRHNCDAIRGPASYSTNEQCGLLVDGFDSPPAVMMNHNPQYYINLIEGYGFSKAKDLLAWRVTEDKFNMRLIELSEQLKERHLISIRKLNMKRFDEDVQEIKKIYNNAWSKNWGFVPMTDEEFNHIAKDFKSIVDPDVVLIAEIDGKNVAFAMALPDINQVLIHLNGRLFPFNFIKMYYYWKKISRARILTLGVLEQYRFRGIDLYLYSALFNNGTKKGYMEGEFSWVLEDNKLMNDALQKMGARCAKIYRIFEKKI